MTGLRVLITNITLALRTGAEINVRDVALGLLRRGHTPIVYTRDPGVVADELRHATVPVVDDLGCVAAPPDVIHGHHHPETMQALLRFPGVPAVFFSHDVLAWFDAPPCFPRILRYIAVDDANRDRLLCSRGVAPERVRVVLNAVDLARFRPRAPLPARPACALVFSNYANDATHLGAVRAACERAGVALDVVGGGVGRQSAAPESLLGGYDLVFAKGRCALEALSVGSAVVLCDYLGLGSLVTTDDLQRLRRLNFGRRLLQAPLDPDLILREIARYDADDAAEVSRRVRQEAGLEPQIDVLEALYRDVIAEGATLPPDPAAELRALAEYLDAWGPRFKDGPLRDLVDDYRRRSEQVEANRQQAHAEGARLRQMIAELEARCTALQGIPETHARLVTEHETLRREHGALDAEAVRLREETGHTRSELAYVTGTATWRLRATLLRFPALTTAYRSLRRLAALAHLPLGRPAPRQSG